MLDVPPASIHSPLAIIQLIRVQLGIKKNQRLQYEIIRKSIDARRRQVVYTLKLRVFIDEVHIPIATYQFPSQDVLHAPEVHIIGAGPAGLFCALQCIELGLKPIIFERGKNVRDRRRDLAKLNKEGQLNEESNYCFGEGGAGTYSDGKLYTRSHKRGNIQKVLSWFHVFGADEKILYEAHPHIGTNKLPHIIEAIRTQIIDCGGEVHFGKKLTDFKIQNNRIQSITLNGNETIDVQQIVLATGHSARDIYELLYRKKIKLEKKPIAIGVRIEHPQAIIDQVQYHCMVRDENLPPASYSLVTQVNGRGVFSFCMCPGGIIAPAATEQNALVVNGWSPSKRNNPYANSGMVVSVDEKDFINQTVLGGLAYQRSIEQQAFIAGGGKFVAPAQRMTDFIRKKNSATLPQCSYLPGVVSQNLHQVLPSVIAQSLADGLQVFGKKMKGYETDQAILVATESRTSSPVRIPRDPQKLHHVQISNLYPCAEGAGYAGGIVSAAMDGMNVAAVITAYYEGR